MENEIEILLTDGFRVYGLEQSDKGCYILFEKDGIIVKHLVEKINQNQSYQLKE